MLFLPRPYSLQFPPDQKNFPIVNLRSLIQKTFQYFISNSMSKIPLNVKTFVPIALHEEKCVIECEDKMRGIQDVKDVV